MNDIRPDEWATIYAVLKARARSLLNLAEGDSALPMATRVSYMQESKRLSGIVEKLGREMGLV